MVQLFCFPFLTFYLVKFFLSIMLKCILFSLPFFSPNIFVVFCLHFFWYNSRVISWLQWNFSRCILMIRLKEDFVHKSLPPLYFSIFWTFHYLTLVLQQELLKPQDSPQNSLMWFRQKECLTYSIMGACYLQIRKHEL